MKHKHHDVIAEWIKDTTQVVEVRCAGSQEWYIKRQSEWHEHLEYRMKPVPKPDIVHGYIHCNGGFIRNQYFEKPVLVVVFDGETGNPKSSEVLL